MATKLALSPNVYDCARHAGACRWFACDVLIMKVPSLFHLSTRFSMPPRRTVCPHHLKGRCNYGARCKFLHTSPAGTQATSGSHSTRNRNNRPTGGANHFISAGLPRDVCRDFWEKGTCDRGFECRFQHRQKNEGLIGLPFSSTSSGSISGTTQINEDAMTKASESFTDDFAFSSLNPQQVHHLLRRFLLDDFRFVQTQDIHLFAAILNSVNSTGGAWTIDDGQTFLKTMGDPSGNGILRVRDILSYAGEVSPTASGEVVSFQRGFMPVLAYLGSEFVTRSTLQRNINCLYGLIDNNFEEIEGVLSTCVAACMISKTFDDHRLKLSGLHVFKTITTCLYEFATRFKQAVSRHPTFVTLVQSLAEWLDTWAKDVCSLRPQFQDSFTKRDPRDKQFLLNRLQTSLTALVEVVERIEGVTIRRVQAARDELARGTIKDKALLDTWEMASERPGTLRVGGPRHDNDHEDIANVEIVPTHSELCSAIDPFLPANIPGAAHHLPAESMGRLVDIQFRLLREELIAPVRTSIGQILEDFNEQRLDKTQLGGLMHRKGGLYKTVRGGSDSVMFSVYTGVTFKYIKCDVKRGLTVEILFDAPSGRAQDSSAGKRKAYCESVGRKRLMQGGLVALVWKPVGGKDVRVYLGVVTSSLEDLIKSSKASADRLALAISFFDPEAELRILTVLQRGGGDTASHGTKLLVEAPVMFESIRPFLETLKTREPTSIPFARYIAHPSNGDLSTVTIAPPAYATPNFSMKLDVLFTSSRDLSVRPHDATSVENARTALRKHSILDPSQADALLDTLTSELGLIQGPPGTGKSYTGIQMLRVLIANKIGPILLIAFTNHALDNILAQVLNKGITKHVIRLGSRSADETVAEYSLDKVMQARAKDRTAGKAFAQMKDLQEKMENLMSKVVRRDVEESKIKQFLINNNRAQHDEIYAPEPWITSIFKESLEWEENTKGQDGKGRRDRTLLDYWRQGRDITFITPPPHITSPQQHSQKKKHRARVDFNVLARQTGLHDTSAESDDEEVPEDPLTAWTTAMNSYFVAECSLPGIPEVPRSNRSLPDLLGDPDPWRMSAPERQKLYANWVSTIKEVSYQGHLGTFNDLKKRHADARTQWNELMDKGKLDVLSKAELIGCTTNGAAKLTSLLKSVGPKVLLVEEAGQVLEAHVLSSLVPSIQQVMLIGDPFQLRPTIENYHLSMDNSRTGRLYRFDQSLMERLSTMGLRMSRLDVQRRMRPRIAELVRSTLYPSLQDHEKVTQYPAVRGMAKDIYFLDHRHPEEGGGDEGVSKTNTYEVRMIKDLVMYFLKQGRYTKSGDIVVLCAYLGQLVKLRKALSTEVATLIDERDAVQLVNYEDNEEVENMLEENLAERVNVSTRVLLRTVDNFQGEEGTIVILSLVRNSGEDASQRRNIGFLKSTNRTNVALSRAREGLYILGNADDLSSHSEMWRGVLAELRRHDQVGPAWPLACHRHPDRVVPISRPGEISLHAPDGGCLEDCDGRLPCGHHCPSKCHSDDEQHRFVRCIKPCVKLCPQGHPCDMGCSVPCGKCQFLVLVTLSCGHVNQVPCYLVDDLDTVRCSTRVQKKLPTCEHSAVVACSVDPCSIRCSAQCGLVMTCCGKPCTDSCGQCQHRSGIASTTTVVPRLKHIDHTCKKDLYCGHQCDGKCTDDHDCSSDTSGCGKRCRQSCSHHACERPCSEPCAPCAEPCLWQCEHHACPVVCGAPCARLPCDERCKTILACGHRCPSVCGEPCDRQICPQCAPASAQNQVVDLVMQTTLSEVDPHGEATDELLITLDCRHIFTVETLDYHCEMEKYYRKEDGAYLRLGSPPTGLQKPPVCPLCRAPIKSMRYGRVFKRADLDMSEQNVANACRRTLRQLHKKAEKFDAQAATQRIKNVLKDLSLTDVPDDQAAESSGTSNSKATIGSTEPTPIEAKNFASGLHRLHRVPAKLADVWIKVAKPLLKAYEDSVKAAMTQSAHVRAYQAAVTTLHHQYLSQMSSIPQEADGWSPSDLALELARRDCGLSAPPKADLRFRVEACWTSFNIRFQMIEMAQAVTEMLQGATFGQAVREKWFDFVDYLVASVQRDATQVMKIAEDSQSHRQLIRTVLFRMEAEYQACNQRVICRGSRANEDLLREFKDQARDGCARAKMTMEKHRREYRDTMSSDLHEQTWLHENFVKPSEAIIERWVALADRINRGVYDKVTDEEKRSIIKAFSDGFLGFSTRGHFYQCPNGHVYVITECGGATERSRCPECGANIGGTNHVLDSTNDRALDFENLAREQGLRDSPFTWGRGA